MNKRIHELAKQAGFNPYNCEGANAVLFKKFAELIIKECLDVLDPENDLTSTREEYGRVMCMNLLRRHFSVED